VGLLLVEYVEAKKTEYGVANVTPVLWMTDNGGIDIDEVQSTWYVTVMDPLVKLAVYEGSVM